MARKPFLDDDPDRSYVGLDHCWICGDATNILINRTLRPKFPRAGVCTGGTCTRCESVMKEGCFLIETRDGAEGKDPYRTGRVWALKDEALKRALSGDELTDLLTRRVGYLHESAAKAMGLHEAPPTEPTPA